MNISNVNFLYALLSLDSYNRHQDGLQRKLSTKDDKQLTSLISDVNFIELR